MPGSTRAAHIRVSLTFWVSPAGFYNSLTTLCSNQRYPGVRELLGKSWLTYFSLLTIIYMLFAALPLLAFKPVLAMDLGSGWRGSSLNPTLHAGVSLKIPPEPMQGPVLL